MKTDDTQAHGFVTRHASSVTPHALRDEKGIALLTSVLLLVALTVIGIAAMTVTGMENKMAGYGRSAETISSAAEACMGTAVKIIQDTIDQGQLPATYLANASPAGPVPVANGPTLQQEIMGQSDNNPDTADASPNTTAPLFNFAVRGDIDRLYAAPKVGGSLQFAGGYEGTAGGAAGGGVDIYNRVQLPDPSRATEQIPPVMTHFAVSMRRIEA